MHFELFYSQDSQTNLVRPNQGTYLNYKICKMLLKTVVLTDFLSFEFLMLVSKQQILDL